MLEDADIKALEGLKLTHTQARVYLAIALLGEAKMSEISKGIGVARQDLYRAASELHKLGLVEKVLGTPIKHRAIPVKDAVAFLRERTRKEHAAIQENASRLVERHKNRSPRIPEETSHFTMIPMKEANIRRRQLLTQKCQKEICKMSSQKRLNNIPHQIFEEIMAALQRGVRIRHLTEKPTDIRKKTANFLQFKATGNFENRYFTKHPSIALTIFDEKEALVSSSSKAHIGEARVLWTNNLEFVNLLQHHFEMLWKESIPYYPK